MRMPPTSPALQWWNGNAWVYVYDRIEDACLSPPLVIAPGAAFSDTVHVRVAASSIAPDGEGVSPFWTGPRIAATYRLIWTLCAYHGGNGVDGGCDALPESALVSAPFRMAFGGE